MGSYSNIQVKVLYAYRQSSRISKPDDTHPVYIESHERGRTLLYSLGISILPLVEQLQYTFNSLVLLYLILVEFPNRDQTQVGVYIDGSYRIELL